MSLTNQQILEQAPEGAEDWTHYCDGIYILGNDAAQAFLDIEYCHTIRSRSDIEAIAKLERENEALRQGKENLETVADVICYEMEQQGVENFLTFGFKRDDKKFEVTLRYVEGKTTAAVMGELRDEIKALKAEREQFAIEQKIEAAKDAFIAGYEYGLKPVTSMHSRNQMIEHASEYSEQLRKNAGGDL